MKKQFYTGTGIPRKEGTSDLPRSNRKEFTQPDKYLADKGLIDAANVALMLGQPLLLTGEAGTGKTQFAYSLAWELGLGDPLKFETKSTSTARDLFYNYDALKRFQHIQTKQESDDVLDYITYQALGLAILRTLTPTDVKEFVKDGISPTEKPTRSVVLIDEIDKSPRDFPNDILNEIENMYFRIPEMGNKKVEANREFPPIVVITSNSEKDLPDAFLRRCVYYNIPFPDESEKERLQAIILNRLAERVKGKDAFIDDALELFYALRTGGLRKPPATAELIGWMMVLKDMAPDAENPLEQANLAERTLSNLIKTTADQESALKIVSEVVGKWQTREA